MVGDFIKDQSGCPQWISFFLFSPLFISRTVFLSQPILKLEGEKKKKKKRWRGKKSKKSTTWVFPLSGPRPGIREGEKIIELEGLKVSQTGRRARPKFPSQGPGEGVIEQVILKHCPIHCPINKTLQLWGAGNTSKPWRKSFSKDPDTAGLRWSKIHLQCGRPGFNPWVVKLPWRKKQLPTSEFLPGEFNGQRCLTAYSPWGRNSQTLLSDFHFQTPWVHIEIWTSLLPHQDGTDQIQWRLQELLQM